MAESTAHRPPRPSGAVRIARVAALLGLVTGLATAVLGGVSACDDAAGVPPSDLDPGPTFGIEVTTVVRGSGRVTSDVPAISCPGTCFARLTTAERRFDSSDLGFALHAIPSTGWRFVGWSADVVPLGTRGRGPSECSPMTRFTVGVPVRPGISDVLLPYGETEGTPPPGRAARCAAYTTVPVAYALTATFEENGATPPLPPDPDDAPQVVFEPPALGIVSAREITVRDARVYFRFTTDGSGDGIATGPTSGTTLGATTLIAGIGIGAIDLSGPMLSFQQSGGGVVRTIRPATGELRNLLAFSQCAALASDDSNVYCRTEDFGGTSSVLYALPLVGGSYTFQYSLPQGRDLAVDPARFYFSRGLEGPPAFGSLLSAPRPIEAGAPLDSTVLATGQQRPIQLLADATSLYWVDPLEGSVAVNTVPKTGGVVRTRMLSGDVTLALDPAVPGAFWAASRLYDGANAASIIYRGDTESDRLSPVLTNLRGVNGVAADATHVYFTRSDGRVYRSPKP